MRMFCLWCQFALGVHPVTVGVLQCDGRHDPPLVVMVSECGDRDTPGLVSSQSDTVPGLKPGQLGCSLCEFASVRDLVRSREASPDQCSGALSQHLGTPVRSTFLVGKTGIGGIRQHLHSGIHQLARGDALRDIHGSDIQPVQCGSVLRVTLRARHILGRLNRTDLSRSCQIVNTEWMLHPQVATHLWMVWGQPMIDLMATELMTRLLVYVSLYPDLWGHAIDPMPCTWTGMDTYVFPRWGMFSEVHNTFPVEDCILTLIAPCWLNRAWFPMLLGMLIDSAVRLLHCLDLVSYLPTSSLLIKAFQVESLAECPLAIFETWHSSSTSQSSWSSLFGVHDTISILSSPLWTGSATSSSFFLSMSDYFLPLLKVTGPLSTRFGALLDDHS